MALNVRMEAVHRILDVRDKLMQERDRMERSFWRFLPWRKRKVQILTQQIDRIERRVFRSKK